MQIFIIVNLEVDLVYNKKDDSLGEESSFLFTRILSYIKKLLIKIT